MSTKTKIVLETTSSNIIIEFVLISIGEMMASPSLYSRNPFPFKNFINNQIQYYNIHIIYNNNISVHIRIWNITLNFVKIQLLFLSQFIRMLSERKDYVKPQLLGTIGLNVLSNSSLSSLSSKKSLISNLMNSPLLRKVTKNVRTT